MSEQSETLEILINDFIAMVESSTLVFERKFGTRDIRRLWRTKAIKRCGRVTRGVKYELHGIGCRINLSTGSVDFNYGPNGEINGFDVWRLYNFARERPSKYKKYCDKKNIEKELEEYINLKKIKKMSAISNLYILTDSKEID
ncbi:hypothetical protein BR1R3_21380 [Pseudomonas atacamensis]|jgi:hypothetical protein|uniref:DUF6896 domain-containing protein n=1 Tax=Pseudomonas atacamensis TaxID=2565368 RepID=UPI0022CCE234|nr:hypothetical protein [Pseudomonas atacamensis]GLH19396.1 hypothetical protein BR1R3_21380 [Pseudomonas atacamensis]